jgi:hypothetical protein
LNNKKEAGINLPLERLLQYLSLNYTENFPSLGGMLDKDFYFFLRRAENVMKGQRTFSLWAGCGAKGRLIIFKLQEKL